jgi:hexosaminidase
MSRLDPARTGVLPGLGLPPGDLPERFALEIRGHFAVPRDGVYVFSLRSDDGSRLEVGGEVVVDNDGIHGPRARSGPMALAAGIHPLRVTYFNAGGSALLEIDVEGPSLPRRRLETLSSTASPR